jgi:hypothetical protein
MTVTLLTGFYECLRIAGNGVPSSIIAQNNARADDRFLADKIFAFQTPILPTKRRRVLLNFTE